ncbi:hypothetical protein EDEG_02194 [Edhazardia aedis USNM 41457]|uniref:Uncharacterized protein n=1 Tax=Edhazardia aedis (strain USNM 41457) TaxID=1003232 RepID=J9D7C6_EDHAE|nr:hypothetical protein EDEG_02194 [Edhazardia aedis USNM 41457]|eukprot:EJW03429.1 hypothetical protein EDEG_02194 [Edhazardia aedis USNM 41457]
MLKSDTYLYTHTEMYKNHFIKKIKPESYKNLLYTLYPFKKVHIFHKKNDMKTLSTLQAILSNNTHKKIQKYLKEYTETYCIHKSMPEIDIDWAYHMLNHFLYLLKALFRVEFVFLKSVVPKVTYAAMNEKFKCTIEMPRLHKKLEKVSSTYETSKVRARKVASCLMLKFLVDNNFCDKFYFPNRSMFICCNEMYFYMIFRVYNVFPHKKLGKNGVDLRCEDFNLINISDKKIDLFDIDKNHDNKVDDVNLHDNLYINQEKKMIFNSNNSSNSSSSNNSSDDNNSNNSSKNNSNSNYSYNSNKNINDIYIDNNNSNINSNSINKNNINDIYIDNDNSNNDNNNVYIQSLYADLMQIYKLISLTDEKCLENNINEEMAIVIREYQKKFIIKHNLLGKKYESYIWKTKQSGSKFEKKQIAKKILDLINKHNKTQIDKNFNINENANIIEKKVFLSNSNKKEDFEIEYILKIINLINKDDPIIESCIKTSEKHQNYEFYIQTDQNTVNNNITQFIQDVINTGVSNYNLKLVIKDIFEMYAITTLKGNVTTWSLSSQFEKEFSFELSSFLVDNRDFTTFNFDNKSVVSNEKNYILTKLNYVNKKDNTDYEKNFDNNHTGSLSISNINKNDASNHSNTNNINKNHSNTDDIRSNITSDINTSNLSIYQIYDDKNGQIYSQRKIPDCLIAYPKKFYIYSFKKK